jgi:hypothetical protein
LLTFTTIPGKVDAGEQVDAKRSQRQNHELMKARLGFEEVLNFLNSATRLSGISTVVYIEFGEQVLLRLADPRHWFHDEIRTMFFK